MKAKKIISMIVAMFMLLTIVSVPAFAADYSMTPSGAALAKYGTTYTLTVKANTPGTVYGAGCLIAYDADIFTPVIADITGCAALNANLAKVVETEGKTALQINSSNDNATYSDAAAWATIPFTVADGTASASASFEIFFPADEAIAGEIAWLDGDFMPVDFAGIVAGSIDVDVVPAHTAPTFDVAIDGDAVSGNDLEAVVSNFVDNWNLDATYAYQWLADGAAIAGATDSAYALDADDFGKAISVKVTATVASDDEATNVVEKTSAATAAVTAPADAPVLTVVETRDDVVAVGVELDTAATAVAADLVGGETTIAYSWKVDGAEVADTATYVPTIEDYGTGASYITCVVTATSARNAAETEKTVSFTKAIVAGNMQPVISNLAINIDAPVVDDVLTVAYDFEDIADTSYEGPADTDASVITWYVDDVEVAAEEDGSYIVKAEDIGKVVKAVVVATSTDATPNENLGLSAEDVVVGNTLEVATEAAAKNPAYAPTVSDVAFSKSSVRVNAKVKVEYAFEDLNGFADASVVTIMIADSDAEDAEWAEAEEGVDYTIEADGSYKFTKEAKGMFVKAVVTAANDDVDPIAGNVEETIAVEVKAAATSSGASLTGPVLGGGSSQPTTAPTEAPTTEPTVEPTVEPTTEPTDAPVVPDAKDCISLAISDKTINAFGTAYEADVAPFIVEDRTVLPVRAICELLGAKVEWIESTRAVVLDFNGRVVKLMIDDKKAVIDGVEVELNIAPFISEDRTFLGLRDMAEAIGMNVEWAPDTMSVYITAK